MIMTGKLYGAEKDILGSGFRVTFTTPELPEDIKSLDREKTLEITAKIKRNKRSLDANSYAWVLMTKIGDELGCTKEIVYVHELERYGQLAFLMKVEHGTDVNLDGLYHKFLEYDGMNDIYQVFRGSSTYDTKEMSAFIDGIVSDCKELGIETAPTMELEKIKKKWHI
jgi:hypothetical protein